MKYLSHRRDLDRMEDHWLLQPSSSSLPMVNHSEHLRKQMHASEVIILFMLKSAASRIAPDT